MKKPKKGKFRYQLDPVLKVREIMEKKQKEALAEKERLFNEEKKKEQELKDMQMQLNGTLRDALVGEIRDFGSILRQRSFLVKVKKDVSEQEVKREKAEEEKEEQREKLVEKVKERQVIEKDKDNKKKMWKKVMDLEETKFLDDIATSQYSRK